MTNDPYQLKKNRPIARARDRGANAECYLCTESINYDLEYPHPDSWSLDHKTPQSFGGGHELSNAVATHLTCNKARYNRPIAYGMFAGARPKPGETSRWKGLVEGSRNDPMPWTDRTRPVDGHTINQDTRCSNCPCFRSQWFPTGYESTMEDAERELFKFKQSGERLK